MNHNLGEKIHMTFELKLHKPDIFIITRILGLLWSRGGMEKKTKLQMASKMNYNIYSKYLHWLENKGLVKIIKTNPRNNIIKITPKGVEAYKRIISWIRDFIDEIDYQ
jgi:predicted transcriptional regulator